MQQKQIIVIGAGIVGVSTALWLQRDGHQVTLLDAEGPAARASWGNAGLLAATAYLPVTGPGLLAKAPAMLLDPNQPLFLRWSYLPRLLPWLVPFLRNANASDTARIAAGLVPMVADTLDEHLALSAGTPAARYVVPCDYVYVYDHRKDFEKEAFGWGIRRQHGLEWQEMDQPALAAFDPFFAHGPKFAVRAGGHGRISDPGAYVQALAAHFQAQGGVVLRGQAEGFAITQGRVQGVRVAGETLACDAAVITAGAWSGQICRSLGYRPNLEAERGYHIELWGASAMPRVPSMVVSGKFVATPMEGRLRLAGVVELGGLEAGPSEAPFALLKRELARNMPGLRWDKMTQWMGHRPSTPDSLPVVGALPNVQGVWAGFGHQHVGLTAGPKTGRLLAQLIAGRRPNIDLAPYDPARFG